MSTRVVAKLLFADWFLKYAPFKALRETHKAYKELEVSFDHFDWYPWRAYRSQYTIS